jgi:hypothetical protein
MNETAELEGLRAYAAMMNTLDATRIEPHLADDFVYESQAVFQPLESKQAFLEYIKPKLETVKRANATVFAELGRVSAYGREQPCVVLAQNSPENLVGLVLAKSEGGKLKRLDLCVVPAPRTAQRTGEYPR